MSSLTTGHIRPASDVHDTAFGSRIPLRRRLRAVFAVALRVLLSLLFITLGAFLLQTEFQLRELEVDIAVWVLKHTPLASDALVSTSAGQPTAAFGYDEKWYALRVTTQCAVAFYLAAVAFFAALVALLPRVGMWRALTATIASMAALLIVNQIRIAVIAYAFSRGGKDAFNWAHGPIGTCIMLVGIAAALIVFFTLCLRRSRRQIARANRLAR